jgi:hypothetical protein
MRVTFYTAVLVVAAGSVVFGLDWISAPMPPMPEAKNIVFLPPPPPPPRRVAAPVTPATIPTPQSAPAPAPQRAAAPASPPPVQTPAPLASPAMVEAPKVKCDIDACAAAYRSFRDSDCTYNPSFGPRRLCTKGDPERYSREHPEIVVPTVAPAPTLAPAPEAPPVAQTAEPGSSVTPSIMAPEPGTAPATPAATPPRCNVAACAASYPRSFKEADCTFQPSIGPRRVCEK